MDVFHLKYRPLRVAELDLPEVRQTIESVLKSPQRSSCFLLAGPKGAGKTSAARILARALNCLKPEGIEPCNSCENCLEILREGSMDVVEIDGASNRGIDDIRQLKQRAYLLPSKLKVKVFIIDEVHMLTGEAFNALLKILEEPPEHTVFTLCTTDPQKIPETVLSRLLRINFRKGNPAELMGSLERVLQKEKIEMPKKAREKMVASSDGSFRNLHKGLNQLVVEYGTKLDLKQVEEYLAKETGDYSPNDLENDLAANRVKKILERFEDLAKKGVDFSKLRLDFLKFFQKRLLASLGVEKGESLLPVDRLTVWLNLLIAAGRKEKEMDLAQLPLELAVVEFLGSEKAGKQESKKVRILRVKPLKQKKKNKTSKEAVISAEEIAKKWQEVLIAVRPYNHSVQAFLRSAKPLKVEGKTVVIEVFYAFHKQKLEENKNREIVEKGLEVVFNCGLRVVFELGKVDKKKAVELKTVEVEESTNDEDMYDVAKEIFG